MQTDKQERWEFVKVSLSPLLKRIDRELRSVDYGRDGTTGEEFLYLYFPKCVVAFPITGRTLKNMTVEALRCLSPEGGKHGKR